ncbi:hypothetical protein KDL45_16565, partial [bacterium]|nr:hypothetical protein [bacterium]
MPVEQVSNAVSNAETKVKGTVLLLQSTKEECDQLQIPLSEVGLNVFGTTSMENALRFYNERTPDLLIVSSFLSGASAFDFCRKIRTVFNDFDTPIILTSVVRSGTLMIEGKSKWGVNDVVVLPVRMEKMMQLILFHLGHEETRPNMAEIDNPTTF